MRKEVPEKRVRKLTAEEGKKIEQKGAFPPR